MMIKQSMRVLDLFCGAGGAAMGLHRAWPDADIVGVDINPQPRYPFKFVQADAMTFPLDGFDFIWASPPCQRWSKADSVQERRRNHPDYITPLRPRLSGKNYCMENVIYAPLVNPTMLCGTMFNLRVFRHRHFETSFPILSPQHFKHNGSTGTHRWPYKRNGYFTVAGHGGGKGEIWEWQAAMGIDWMTKKELAQAVPPAYSEFIARQFLDITACRWPEPPLLARPSVPPIQGTLGAKVPPESPCGPGVTADGRRPIGASRLRFWGAVK